MTQKEQLQLGKTLWNIADQLRGAMNADDFRDYMLFHEYFNGDTGKGIGASHQTGWTATVAKLLQPTRTPKGKFS